MKLHVINRKCLLSGYEFCRTVQQKEIITVHCYILNRSPNFKIFYYNFVCILAGGKGIWILIVFCLCLFLQMQMLLVLKGKD